MTGVQTCALPISGAARRTRLTVRLKDGSSLQHQVEAPRTVGAPLSNQEVQAKYRTLTDGIVDRRRQAAIADCILGLEKLPTTIELSRLLAPEVAAPFP